MNSFPDHVRPNPDVTGHSVIASHGFPTLPRWVSMSSTFRPSIRLDIRFEKARTIPSLFSQVTLAVLGPLDRKRAVTRVFIPNSAHSKTLTGSARRLLSTDLKSLSTLPFNARQTIRMRGSIRNGSESDQTARFN